MTDAAVTHYVASFVSNTSFNELPTHALAMAKKSFLDGIGLAFAGAVAESGVLIARHLDTLGLADGPSTVIGGGRKIAPRFAAFANGVAIHADDFDDTQLAVAKDRVYGLLTHPTAPCLPAALAMGEERDASGRDVMLAYMIGVDIECKIAEAIHPRHYQTGFHSTATCGPFAAAAAAAKLMGATSEAITRALGLAGSQSAGLRENFGTMTKPFHAGRAAEAGVVAAQLAGMGWTATDKILEAPRGFFRAAGGGYDESAILGKLGAPWAFTTPGISIKPHPCGSLTHPGMTALLGLIRAHNIRASDVKHVRVGTNSNMPNALIHHRPTDELQAKFSMEFCMAILLVEGRANLSEFNDATVNRADIKAMIEKIDFGVNEEAERAGFDKMTTIIDLELNDGRKFHTRADFGKGSPANPMSYEETADKFRSCCDFARVPKKTADEIVAMVRDLETLPSISKLTALLIKAG